jgi:hypothetical protein
MQEFSSISVSSYEAGALTEQLGEQSRAGWSVVAIVPTGSTVTAYLSRDAQGGDDDHEAVSDSTPATPESTTQASDDAAPAAEPSDAPTDPVGEAPGWAAGSTDAADEPASSDSRYADDHFTVADEPASEPAAAEPSATTATSTTSAAADAGAAPAGWYADPSSRFELRYWDGSQWTEHVSRAGQQYTDPPVA